MSAANRALKVQTPGAAPAQQAQPEAETPKEEVQATTPAESSEQTPGAAPADKTAPTKADYAAMPASQVDATALTAPVLSRDGWVCPVPAAKA